MTTVLVILMSLLLIPLAKGDQSITVYRTIREDLTHQIDRGCTQICFFSRLSAGLMNIGNSDTIQFPFIFCINAVGNGATLSGLSYYNNCNGGGCFLNIIEVK